ncbi:MAG: Mur ligase family protein [Pseudomonadota bacterium]
MKKQPQKPLKQRWRRFNDKRRLFIRRIKAKRSRAAFGDKPVIGVTGSVGKTSACAFLGHVLSKQFEVVSPLGGNTIRGNIGNLRRLKPSKDMGIFEVASGGPGTIAPQVKVIRPNVAIVTKISTDHYSAFRSLEATAKEKAELVRALPSTGLCLLNGDDTLVRTMQNKSPCTTLFFGEDPQSDYRVHTIEDRGLDGIAFSMTVGDDEQRFEIDAIGTQIIPSYAGGIACAHRLGLSLSQIAYLAKDYTNAVGRCSLHQQPGRPIFINDAAKAPSATLADAFGLLANSSAPRKTIFIGQISDYAGSGTTQYRRACKAADRYADRIIMLRDKSNSIRAGVDYGPQKEFQTVDNASELTALINATAIEGEIILLKSSLNLHCERVIMNEVTPVQCWRTKCPNQFMCTRCKHPFDPECATAEKEPERIDLSQSERAKLLPPRPKH